MTKSAFAAHSQIRNVVLCSLFTLGLAACGADGASSDSDGASASSSVPSLVAPNVGFVDRTSDTATASSSTSATAAITPVANTTPAASSAPVSGTSSSSTSSSNTSTV